MNVLLEYSLGINEDAVKAVHALLEAGEIIKSDRKIIKSTDLYDVYEELWTHNGDTSGPSTMTSAYTKEGWYIGNPDTAKFLCDEKGIKPELRTNTSCVCSIGYSQKDQKWYGWSHRAIFGFTIGDKVKKGNIAYKPQIDELYEKLKKKSDKYTTYVRDGNKVIVTSQATKFIPNDPSENDGEGPGMLTAQTGKWVPAAPYVYEIEGGKGEWEAKTMDDAKQMAIDFAEGVS